ncbi:MAG: hypothetical protein VX257_03355, partial [Planctomycetota bacterium]|nr:hypothetical protein [Planctomycetota bacterium]
IVPFGEHSFSRGSGPSRVERGQMMLPPALFVHKADGHHPRNKKDLYSEKPQLLRPVARALKAPRPGRTRRSVRPQAIGVIRWPGKRPKWPK